MSNKIKIKVTKKNDNVSNISKRYNFKDILEIQDKLKFSDIKTIYKCKIKYIYEAFKTNEIQFSEDNRMIDNSRVNELKDNFDINKCDFIILAELKNNIANTINKLESSNDSFDELSDISSDDDSDDISDSDNETSDETSDESNDLLDVSSNSYKYLIIDGQHRITMITKLDIKDPIMEKYVSLDIRQCKTREEFKNYIDSTNDRKNFSSDQLRSFKFPRLRELFTDKYQDCFTTSYIKINETTFKEELFKTNLFEDFNITPEIIVDKLMSINDFFRTIEDKSKLSTTHNLTKKSYVKERSKSEKMNFFLGLDEKCRWIKLLDIETNEFLNEWIKIYNKYSRTKK